VDWRIGRLTIERERLPDPNSYGRKEWTRRMTDTVPPPEGEGPGADLALLLLDYEPAVRFNCSVLAANVMHKAATLLTTLSQQLAEAQRERDDYAKALKAAAKAAGVERDARMAAQSQLEAQQAALRGLVDKLRGGESETGIYTYDAGYEDGLNHCADELSALLDPPQETP
jgi:hypothetical protein